jgi:hypothetical protein
MVIQIAQFSFEKKCRFVWYQLKLIRKVVLEMDLQLLTQLMQKKDQKVFLTLLIL